MRNVSQDLADAITAPERTVRIRLSCDWDGDGHGSLGTVDDLSDKISTARLSRTLQADVPPEVNIVEGSVVGALSADLAVGDTSSEELDAVRYWSVFNTASPMYGRQRMGRDVALSVEFLTAAGWQSVPRLQGVTRALPVDVGSRLAKLSVLDPSQRMRAKLSLPAVIAEAPANSPFPTDSLQAPGLESTWVASFVCAQNGIYVSPPPRPGCRLWLPMHGSAFPFIADMVIGVGTADVTDLATSVIHNTCTFETGPFLLGTTKTPAGYQLQVTGKTTHDADPAQRIVASTGHVKGRVEFWARTQANATTAPFGIEVINDSTQAGSTIIDFAMLAATSQLQLTITDVVTSSTVTANSPTAVTHDGNWHFFGVWFDTAAGQVQFNIDGAVTAVALGAFTPTAWVPSTSFGESYDYFIVGEAGVAFAEMQFTGGTEATDLWLNQIPWTQGAVIDRGYPLLGVADTKPQDSWQILDDLQAAVLGAVWFDEDGVLQVAMPGRLITSQAQAVQRTVTSQTDIVDLAYDDRADTVRNRIICPYQPVVVHVADTMWTAPATVVLTPGQSVTIYATFSGPFVTTPILKGSANTRPDGTGTDVTLGIIGLGTQGTYPTAQEGIFTLTNASLTTVWLVDATGANSLRLEGDWVEQVTGAVPPDYSAIAPGDAEQPLDVGSNVWRQDRSVAAGVAMALLCNLRQSRQTLTKLTIPLDPRLQFYDRIRLTDRHGTGLDTPFWVTGIDEDYATFLAELTARQAQPRFLAGTGLVGVDLAG